MTAERIPNGFTLPIFTIMLWKQDYNSFFPQRMFKALSQENQMDKQTLTPGSCNSELLLKSFDRQKNVGLCCVSDH